MSCYASSYGQLETKQCPPIIETFEPFDPSTSELAANFTQRYVAAKNTNGASLYTLISPHSWLGPKGTWEQFPKEIFRQIPAVAFIGHSIVPDTMTKYGYPNRLSLSVL